MSEDKDSIEEQLRAPFPPEMLRVNQAKGITYVPIAEVIARMNRVIGAGKWEVQVVDRWTSGEIVTPQRGTVPAWCMAHVRITAQIHPDGPAWVSDGVGGQAVKMRTDGVDAVDVGDEWKAAVSDATKKALMLLGVSLDLARKEDAMIYEARLERDLATPAQLSELNAMMDALGAVAGGATAVFEQKTRLREVYLAPQNMTADEAAEEVKYLRALRVGLLQVDGRASTQGGNEPDTVSPPADQPDEIDNSVPAPQKAASAIVNALAESEADDAQMFEGWFLGRFEKPFNGGETLTIEEAEEAMDYLGVTPEDTRA